MKIKCYICKNHFEGEKHRKVCSKRCRGIAGQRIQKSNGRKPSHGGCVGGISPLYGRWACIKARCLNPNYHGYHRYGGRGITICQEWKSFQVFRDWAFSSGFRPELQIDRINNDGNYEPSNCRWVSPITNANNKRDSIIIPNGKSVSYIAKIIGITPSALRARMRSGMPIEIAITLPKIPNGYARKTFKAKFGKWKD